MQVVAGVGRNSEALKVCVDEGRRTGEYGGTSDKIPGLWEKRAKDQVCGTSRKKFGRESVTSFQDGKESV